MQYLFICKECLEMEDKNISMADYDEEKDKQTCSKCGGKMERVIENFLGASLCSGMFGVRENE